MSSTPPSTPPSLPPSPTTNPLSDIFSDSPPPTPNNPTHHPSEPSDLPRLRSTHITAGYRTGISVSKTPSLQPGFDEGYSLGAVFGLRIGGLIGMLEGLYACACSGCTDGGGGGRDDEKVKQKEKERERVGKLVRKAREELSVERVFGREWWDGSGDGGWRYEVGGAKGEREVEVTRMEVVEGHPVVRGWEGVVAEEVERRGVRRGVFEGEGWEGGRVGDGD